MNSNLFIYFSFFFLREFVGIVSVGSLQIQGAAEIPSV